MIRLAIATLVLVNLAAPLLAWAWRSPDIGEWRPDQDWTDEQPRALRVAGVL